MTNQMMDHPLHLEIPYPACFITTTSCNQVIGNITCYDSGVTTTLHGRQWIPLGRIPNLDRTIDAPTRCENVGSKVVVSSHPTARGVDGGINEKEEVKCGQT